MTDSDLERALIAVGGHVAFPETPDFARRVCTVLEADARELGARNRRTRSARRLLFPASRASRFGLAAACLLIAIVASLALVPEVRTAIADRLGLRGVRIGWLENAPDPPPTSVGATLMLGRAVTLHEVQAEVDFPVLVPTSGRFASPHEIYVSGEGADAMVSIVYPAAPDLPADAKTGVGALLTQFSGRTDRPLIEKGLLGPNAGGEPRTRLEPVTIQGEPGYWITGASHAVFFVCSGVGECRQEPYRLAGDVLLWEHQGVTLRLESALSKVDALAVAESVVPAEEWEQGTTSASAGYKE